MRTIADWYNILITEKNTFANLSVYQPNIDSSQTLLNDLKSTSKVARWRLMLWVVATCAFAMDVVQQVAIVIMQDIAERSRYGTLAWWVGVAKGYQHGDALVLINLEWKYATENDVAKVIKFASAQEGDGQVNIKIATLSGDNTVPVSNAIELGFIAYCQKKKPAGVRLNFINDVSDDLKLSLDIRFDPLLLTDTGELISTPGTYPVKDAVSAYRKNLEFNGAFELMKLVDTIQYAQGVVTAYVTSAQARYGSNPFVIFTKNYFPNAGHVVIAPNDLIITYTANV
jgi:hypothetical protein